MSLPRERRERLLILERAAEPRLSQVPSATFSGSRVVDLRVEPPVVVVASMPRLARRSDGQRRACECALGDGDRVSGSR